MHHNGPQFLVIYMRATGLTGVHAVSPLRVQIELYRLPSRTNNNGDFPAVGQGEVCPNKSTV
jgi:hypothetical protein